MKTLTVENWRDVVSESLSWLSPGELTEIDVVNTDSGFRFVNRKLNECLTVEQTIDSFTTSPILRVYGEMFTQGSLLNFAVELPSTRGTQVLKTLHEMFRRLAWPILNHQVESSQMVHAKYSVPVVQQEFKSATIVRRAEASGKSDQHVTVTATPQNVVSYVSNGFEDYGPVRMVAVRFLKDNVPMTLKLTPDEAKKLSYEIDMTLTYAK